MALELTFIGTGNAFAPTRYWSSFLLNDRYLFDAPPQLLAHLKRLGKDPNDIDLILLSHFHGDHYFGLPFLFLHYAELVPREKELTIIGPPGLGKRLKAVTGFAFANVFRKRVRGYELNFVEAKDHREYTVGDAQILARQVDHVSNLDCFGYRVTTPEGTVAYSGDCVMCDPLVPLARGADVFVVECSCWGDQCGPHLTPKDVLTLRDRIAPPTKFVLTHIGAGEMPQALGDAGMVTAEDLQTLRFDPAPGARVSG